MEEGTLRVKCWDVIHQLGGLGEINEHHPICLTSLCVFCVQLQVCILHILSAQPNIIGLRVSTLCINWYYKLCIDVLKLCQCPQSFYSYGTDLENRSLASCHIDKIFDPKPQSCTIRILFGNCNIWTFLKRQS